MMMSTATTRVIAAPRPSTSNSNMRHPRTTGIAPIRRAGTTRRRAGGDAEGGNENEERTTSTSSPEYGLNPLTGEPLEEKGQMTAIVTGIVSVALAVGYLGLVQLMDSRDMLPPPPEALGDGSVDLSRVGR
jgi:hypothetical protein